MPEGTRRGVDSEELRTAIAAVVSGLEPDQIILFGSAARGEMTEDSDLDLLVIKENGSAPRPTDPPDFLGDVGRDVDVLITTRASAEAGREYAGDVRSAALETGVTVYTRTGFDPIETGTTMVKRTLYKPDHARDFLDRAERKWRIANTPQTHPADRCENLQASLEQALKGLTVAQGRQVEHSHKLKALWDEAERDGERIAATRNDDDLDDLTKYAGAYQYWNPKPGMPEKIWNATRATGRDVLEHARRRIPALVEATRERLKSRSGTPGGKAP